ncbi:protein containing Region of unknown function DUF1828 [Candidatus Magnetobacterium bavaricum]|uniref:DUF1829 domain-containing protein n=1 Tax=Candidatus Magnetobacterium bavaricum TaxID=29290 RepID=A0A0F3GXH1_9BACT|nr:protein containing Region of unknown function DUF1828 [Candidatus Magnetobacterium bavaricum]
MIMKIQQLIIEYNKWIQDKTILKDIGNNWIQITTPYLDRHNDYLQIYVTKQNDKYFLTDDGYIFNDLLNSGCNLESIKRQELLKITLAGFGVIKKGDTLEVNATDSNFSLKKHSLIQAMLSVNDMFYLASSTITNLFLEDVELWLDLADIRFTPKVKFTGKSTYDHVFDFVIPKSRIAPERIIQTFNKPSRDTAEAFVFKWIDTKEVRSTESQAYAILNDQINPVSDSVIDALKNYQIKPVTWCDRELVKQELAA